MNQERKMKFGFVTVILITSCVIGYLTVVNIDVKGDGEWSNNSTLIVEVGIGIIVTLTILMITKISEYRMDAKVSNVLDIVKERAQIQKEKEKQVYLSTLSSFNEIQEEIIIVLNASTSYERSKDHADKETQKDQIILSCNRIKKFSEKALNDPNKISSEFFDLDTIGKIKTISHTCKNKPEFSENNKTVDVSFCSNLKNMIGPIITELNKKIEPQVGLKQPKLEDDVDGGSITVSSDRTVYPLNSTMHMRVNLPYVIKDMKVLFEVFNFKEKLLLSQTIDPEKHDDSELAEGNIFQACFKMEGDEWKIGETYVVRATYGSSQIEDSFTIDQRMPIVLSDKTAYSVGSKIILTIIDPDADKDNEVVEFVGDREDSKIIIESTYGKIDGYRLKETGPSTGIFTGSIGILGIGKNGIIIPQDFDGKIRYKTQGISIDDGFIGGANGDEITIRYMNSANVVSSSVFILDSTTVV